MTQQRGGAGQAQAQDSFLQRGQVLQAKNIKLEGTAVPPRAREVLLQAHHLRRQGRHLRQGKTGHPRQLEQHSWPRRLQLQTAGHNPAVFHSQVQARLAATQQHSGSRHLRAKAQRLRRIPLHQAAPRRTQALLQREEGHSRAWRLRPFATGQALRFQVQLKLDRIGN